MTRPDPAIAGDGPPVVPREQAVRDIDAAIALDLNADGPAGAAASPRCAHERSLPGLHSWPFSRDPYVIFCVVQETHVDVWRVLYGRSDIPQGMQNPIEL